MCSDPFTPDYTEARDTELRTLFKAAIGADPPDGDYPIEGSWPELVKFAKAVAGAEREACAKECEQIADESIDSDPADGGIDPSDPETALYCAHVIRQRARIDETP